MNKIDLPGTLINEGLSKKSFSIKLSNPYAHYHIALGIGLVWEVFYKDERSGKHLYKRKYQDEEDAKKYLIDLVRVNQGKNMLYNRINSVEQFNSEKQAILNKIDDKLLQAKPDIKQKVSNFKKLFSEFEMNSSISEKDHLFDHLLEVTFLIGEDFSNQINFFIESIH